MSFNDSFGIFGHYAFSSKPTHGRSIYESLVDGMGDSYNTDFNGIQQARLYADSMCLASAQYQLDRALNNSSPAKATELLGQLEKDFQVTPGPNDTLPMRRAFLSALLIVSRGNTQGAIEAGLIMLLGSDFVSYSHLSTIPFPTNPETVGIFESTGAKVKQFTLNSSVSVTGVPITIGFTLNPASELPLAGESYTVDPDPRSTIEKVTISAVSDATITATFTRSHEANAIATRPYPFWSSSRRYSQVVVSLSAAQDTEKRRRINELMARATRGVSQWCIVSDQGSFILDSATRGILGCTRLA